MQASIEKQKEAIRKQAAPPGNGFFTVGWLGLPPIYSPAPDCEALLDTEIAPLITRAAESNKLDAALLRAVIKQESGFRACAVSPKGAMGLMQLMPATVEQYNVKDPFNAAENIAAGAQFLKQLVERFKGDLNSALAAYNAGPERPIEDAMKIPETQNYVKSILSVLDSAGPGSGVKK